jgi:hypothetical protein
MKRILVPALALLAVLGMVLWRCGGERSPAGPQDDEARRAGRDAASFPQAAEDWFHDMDGGIELTDEEIQGRNTWLVWTGGNEAMWDHLANNSFGAFDLLKTLSSHPELPARRSNRASYLGLWNEPGFSEAAGPDPERHGLWLDRRVGDWRDPFEDAAAYPGVAGGSFYGEPSGIVGLRLFPNPEFDAAAAKRWDAERFYTDPAYYLDRNLVRPYRVGMACAFCHVGPSPTNPPPDPENPGWEHLASLVGAQYFWNGRIFFYQPDPTNFVSQLFSAPMPGTSDTSLIATDNIFNPRTMNAIYEVGARLAAAERWGHETLAGGARDHVQLPALTLGDGSELHPFTPPDQVRTPHVLKDGADSVGVLAALDRVYINIGTAHEEWFRHFTPILGGRAQSPIEVAVAREHSSYWHATEQRAVNLALFFVEAARPHRLADAPGGAAYLSADADVLERGKEVFAANCARCHSSKAPEPPSGVAWFSAEYRQWVESDEWRAAMTALVKAPDFLAGNYLSNDHRVPVTVLGTNICSPLASNATAGNVWDNFSSATYKGLPAVGKAEVADPFDLATTHEYTLPGGGRGYTRVPSLVSLWSTAPYLLNNTLGEFVNDPSVAGRMRSFQASIEQLLWPDRRVPYVARTTAPSDLKVSVSYLQAPLKQLIGVFSRLFGNGVIEIGPIPRGTPIGLLASLELNDPARHRELMALVPALARELAAIRARGLDDAAAAARLRESIGPRLLALSKCPDFVLNRGHEFGASLGDADKLALIEFLKTF